MNQDGSLTFEEAFGKPSGAQPEGLTFEEAFGRTPQPSLWERANTPLVPWPKIDEDTGIDTADGRPVSYADNKYAVVIANKVREIGESFTSPLGIGLMAAGPLGKGAQALGAIKTAKVLHGTASAAGIGLGAHGLARGVPELVQAEDGPHRLAAALDAALSTAMVAGGVAGVRNIKNIKANVKEHTKEAFDADAAETRRLMDEGKHADAADKSVEKIEYIDGETVTVEGGKAPTDVVTITKTGKSGKTVTTLTREDAEAAGLLPKKATSVVPVEPVFPPEPTKVIDAVVDDGTVTASAADLAKAAEIEKTGVPTEDAPAAAVRIPELSEPPQPMRQRDYAAEMARRSPEEEAIAAAREIERKQPEPLIAETPLKGSEVSPAPPPAEPPRSSVAAKTAGAEPPKPTAPQPFGKTEELPKTAETVTSKPNELTPLEPAGPYHEFNSPYGKAIKSTERDVWYVSSSESRWFGDDKTSGVKVPERSATITKWRAGDEYVVSDVHKNTIARVKTFDEAKTAANGFIRSGDRYVYKPAAKPAPAAEKPAASTGRNPLAVTDEPTASPKTAANKTASTNVDVPEMASHARVQDGKGGDMMVPVAEIQGHLKNGALTPDQITGWYQKVRGEFKPLETKAPTAADAARAGIADAKARINKAYEDAQKLGAVADPKAIAKNNAEMYHALYDLAVNYIKLGVHTAAEFAQRLGVNLTKAIENAFNDAKAGKRNPPEEYTAKLADDMKKPDIGSGEMRDAGVNVKAAQGRRPDISEGMVEGAKSAEKYEEASTPKMAAAVRGMTDEKLAAITPDNPLYTAALTERAVRAERAGDGAAANALFAESAKAATTAGQQGAYFKFLLAHEPYVYVSRVGRKVMEAGYDPLTAAKKIALKEHVEKAQAAIAELEKATDAYKMDESAANGDALLKAHEAAAKAERDLLNKTSAMLPHSVWSTLKTILQGNLLAPISQVANPVGNVIFTPARSNARGVSTVVDVLDTFFTGHPRQITVVSPSTAAKNLVGSLGKSWSETGDIMRHGAGDVVKNEHGRGIHPVLAWRDRAALAAEMPTINGKLSAGQLADVWLQRTFGITAEPMLRLLAAADRFATNPAFKNAVDRQAALRTINGKASPLTAEQLKVAHTMPELFFKPDVVKLIRDEALRATFQQESPVIRMLNGAIHKQGPFAEFMFATVAPYKLTPWNIIGEIFSYNPIVATANMGRHASLASSLGKKAARSKAIGETELARKQQSLADMNRREAKIAAGKLFVGGLLSASAWYLYKKGILSPSYDASDEATKTRIQAGDILAPNHMNISALSRLKMFGGNGDTMPRKGDTTVDVFRAGGLAGAFFYMAANLGRDMERSKDANSDEIAKNVAKSMTVEMMRYGINQSFLKGVAGILESAKEGRLDTVTQNWISAVVSIPLPNTLAAVSRATRDYKPDTKPEKFMDNFTNAVANRIGGVSRLANKAFGTPIADAYMPLKRDVWGRPMEETPAGRSAFWYHFADVFKFQQASDSPLDMEVYRLARKTGSTEAIPSIPMPEFKFGRETFKLDREHYAQFVELIGQNRRRMAEMIVTNPNFHTLPDAIKLRMLQRMYDAGEKIGKAQFLRRVGNPRQTFTKASARAGFVPE